MENRFSVYNFSKSGFHFLLAHNLSKPNSFLFSDISFSMVFHDPNIKLADFQPWPGNKSIMYNKKVFHDLYEYYCTHLLW